jgi:hypothetical protein
MKKIIILLLFLPALAQAQTITIDVSPIYDRVRKAEVRLDSLVKSQGSTTPPPVIRPSQNPPCEYGPDIIKIESVTNRNLIINFSGKGAYIIDFRVTKGYEVVATGTIRPTSDRPLITFGKELTAGTYTLALKGDSCRTDTWKTPKDFVVPGSTGGGPVIPPPVVNPGVPNAGSAAQQFGTFAEKVGDRIYTSTKHPDLEIRFNADGSITDVTPGLSIVNGIARYKDRNRFYMLNHVLYEANPTTPLPLQTEPLPDGIFSVLTYDTDLDYATLRDERVGGWIRKADWRTTIVKYVYFESTSPGKSNYLSVPEWHKISAKILIPVKEKSTGFGTKRIATSLINDGDKVQDWWKAGYITQRNSNPNGQNSFATYQLHGIADNLKGVLTDDAQMKAMGVLYQAGWHRASDVGCGASIITTQFAEDEIHHKFKNGDALIDRYYDGVRDYCVSNGVADIKDMPGYGEYGMDGNLKALYSSDSEKLYKESLTSKLHNRYDVGNSAWREGATAPRSNRNENHATYFQDNPIKIIFGALYMNELSNLRTEGKTTAIGYSMPYYESAGGNLTNNTVIRFPNGVLANNNDYTPVCPNLMFRHGLYLALITNGYAMWDVERIGIDSTKVGLVPVEGRLDQVRWWPNGASGWEQYQSGKSGAPINDASGVTARMSAIGTNASFAGVEALRDVLDRIDGKIELVSYKSTLGDFAAKGGDAGLSLNGHGPINRNNFDQYKLRGKGYLLKCTGKTGKVVYFYCNESIRPDQYEIVRFDNIELKAYGTQVYKLKV